MRKINKQDVLKKYVNILNIKNERWERLNHEVECDERLEGECDEAMDEMLDAMETLRRIVKRYDLKAHSNRSGA